MKSEKDNSDYITCLYAGFIIVATVVICIIATNINSLGNTDKVLALIGILATFVVISNYAQLVEIRNKTDKRIKELEDKLENMNDKVDGMERFIEIDTERIKTKFEGIEKMMFVAKGEFYRYYVIYQQDKYKMVEIKGKDAFELSFKKFLSRYDDESVKDMFRRMLKDFGVPDDLLDKD